MTLAWPASFKGTFNRDAKADFEIFVKVDGLGDLLETGPTLTNVNDFRAVLIEKT